MKIGQEVKMGKESLVNKKFCRVSEILVKHGRVEDVKRGLPPSSPYLGRVVIPGTLYKLEFPIMYNKKHEFIYTILAGESKDGFCNLKLNSPEGKNETKAIKDIKTAAVQIFCAYTDLPAPKRNGGGSCASCKHKRLANVRNKEGEVEKHSVCGLDGLVVDKDWHKLKKYISVKDTGLIGKKEKTTITYEHVEESPYLTARNGRYRNTSSMKRKHTDEAVNCPFYGPWFHIAKKDKWVMGESRQLPWDGSRVIGSEVIIDAGKYVSNKEVSELEKLLKKMGLTKDILRKLAHSGESEEVLRKTLEILSITKIKNQDLKLLIEEIKDMKDN